MKDKIQNQFPEKKALQKSRGSDRNRVTGVLGDKEITTTEKN